MRTHDLEGEGFLVSDGRLSCYIVPLKCKINDFQIDVRLQLGLRKIKNSMYNSINYSVNMSAKSILR